MTLELDSLLQFDKTEGLYTVSLNGKVLQAQSIQELKESFTEFIQVVGKPKYGLAFSAEVATEFCPVVMGFFNLEVSNYNKLRK